MFVILSSLVNMLVFALCSSLTELVNVLVFVILSSLPELVKRISVCYAYSL